MPPHTQKVAYVRRFAAARMAWLDKQLGYHPTAISSTRTEGPSVPLHIYSLEGIRRSNLQSGLNIIRHSDGSSKKIWKPQN